MEPPNSAEQFATEIVRADASGVARAAALIGGGQCVAVPTETVYGLAADATNPAAVARIYAAKGRPGFNPLIVHVGGIEEADALVTLDGHARELAERHWPGPLTLVLPTRTGSRIAPTVTAGLATLAIRVPAHPVMRALIAETGRPLAAPSANRSGGISPTAVSHVLRTLDGRIPLILDGGPTSAGLESTIVAFTGGPPRLLRPGPLTAKQLGIGDTATRGIEAPGQLESHYKPAKPLTLNVTAREPDTWLIGFGAVAGDACLGNDLAEAAALLYARLHEADASTAARIAVAPVPAHGVGAAINDRLARAAA